MYLIVLDAIQKLMFKSPLPKKQYCDSCEELITELERDSIYFDFQQWLQHIEYMMMQKSGIWCIQSKDNSLLFFFLTIALN